jgi:TRAP transporter TAXI family solute receptor
MSIHKKSLFVGASFLMATAVTGQFAVSADANAQSVKLPRQIIIATNRVGGVSNTMANGFAKVLTQFVGTKATVRPVGNAAKWMGMIKSDDIDLGMTSVTELSWAYWGTNAYKGRPNRTFSLVALGRRSAWTFMVPEESPVHTPEQLKTWMRGKRLSHKWINPIIDHLNRAGLANLGFTGGLAQAGLTAVPVSSYKVFVSLWIENKVDVIGTPPGIPLVRRMQAGRKGRFIPMFTDAAAVARMQKVEPAYYIGTQRAGVPGVKKPIQALSFDYCIIARNSLDKGVVQKVLETLYAHQKELGESHGLVKGWLPADKKWANDRTVLPYHPGAIDFYKAKGLWNDKIEAKQAELVARSKG